MRVYCVLLVQFYFLKAELIFPNEWQQFKETFNKTYKTPQDEHERYQIFEKTQQTVSGHNRNQLGYKLGNNFYADMTFDEFKYLNEGQSNESSSSETYDEVFKIAEFELEVNCNLSSSLDWRLFGAVSRVKNQKLCGSCFIFAVIASIECHLFLNTEKLLDLSVQEVVDCGGKFQGGCDGGTASLVFDYVNTKGGLALYSDYPYEAVRNTCRSENYQRQNISKVTFLKNPNYDEVLLQNALHMYGPIVIFLDIAHESFMRYSRGIYFNTDCTHITNHVALLVGYDSDNGLDYWIVKNSFGESWGEGGYIRIARNQNNQCGIGTVYYAIEKDGN